MSGGQFQDNAVRAFPERLGTIMAELREQFMEREEEIGGALLAMLAGEHVLFIGPPGTAKSQMAKAMCERLRGAYFYYYLLTRFTSPEEVFGPLSLSSLQRDEFRRRTEGYLPQANIAFLDEIFKANSSILNSLLTILNERRFHNGSEVVKVPILSVYGASNELPNEEEGLAALYDRFLYRFFIANVQDEGNFLKVLTDTGGTVSGTTMEVEDVDRIKEGARSVTVDEEVLQAYLSLRKHFRSQNVYVSDRRWNKTLTVLRTAAAAMGRSKVDPTFLPLLQHMLWDRPEQKEGLRDMLIDLASSGGVDLRRLQASSEELLSLLAKAKQSSVSDAQFPRPVCCYDCGSTFMSAKELCRHGESFPNHVYMDPYAKDAKGLNPSYRKFELPELMHVLENVRGWKVTCLRGGAEHRLYERELQELRAAYQRVRETHELERGELRDRLDQNIWLSQRDRRDILARQDHRLESMSDIERSLKEVEAELKG
ncbi:MAG: AAA domain-containing protein [Euryarchaeota archaeon]|nr:AAA domain-containing protein [Euryarchaeota archaeon]